MIRNIRGKILEKRERYVVLEVGGIGFRIFTTPLTLNELGAVGAEAKLATHLHFREDAIELYGFLHASERELFERLNAINGIGPKSALNILGIARAEQIAAAINEGKTELLSRASGIGKKTAERIILELKGKLEFGRTPQMANLLESDMELEDTLVSLGFSHADAKRVIARLDPAMTGFKERLKAALHYNKKQ